MDKQLKDIKIKNSVLGRGLGALLGENIILSKDSNIINEVPIDKIETNPMQPRKFFDKQKLDELAFSIKENGIIQPITIKKINNDRYQLIAGERRLRASKIIGLKTVPAFIRKVNDDKLLELALVENIQRDNLNPIEIALSYQKLINECKFTQEKIAQRVGKKRSTITNFLRILKLPLDIQIALKENKISMGHAKALVNIKDKNIQLKILNKIILNNLSVRKVEELVKKIEINNPNKKENSPIELKNYTSKLKDLLKQRLDTKINIKINEKHIDKDDELLENIIGKGEIIIKFNSKEKLDDLIRIIAKK